MSREIKFRAWDEDNKKMWYWSSENIHESGFWEKGVRVNKHIPMQYTGLNDKYNCEVYENDIVFLNDSYGGEFIGIVLFGFYNKEDDYGYFIKLKNGVEISLGISIFQIIGNKFKNPKLMQKRSNS